MPSGRAGDREANVDGTQAIRRAAAILRRIGQANSRGIGLSDIAGTLDLPRSTTHRILKCLVEEGLVRHDPEHRRYLIGRLTYELGLAATGEMAEIARWQVAVRRIAERTGVTSYLLRRSGIEVVCIFKTEGNSVIRVIPVDVGERRFLGVGAGSCALLAALDPEESEQVIETIAPSLVGYPALDAGAIRSMVADARQSGVAISHGHVVENVIGVGIAIPEPGGTPHLALSIAALTPPGGAPVIEGWTQVIRQEIGAVLAQNGTSADGRQ